jgi:hypothetical protein
VLDIADEYHEIPDLLMRHATLEATNKARGPQDSGFRVQGSGFRAQGSGFRV